MRWRRRLWVRIPLVILAVLLVVAGGAAGYGWWRLEASKPQLEGRAAIAGLTGPVSVTRDALGVPTLRGRNREDLARALGFLHGQERFFQMDTLRRSGAGELAELVGAGALPLDRERRVHRFRARAEARWPGMEAGERALLEAYAAGVNAGLESLGAAPFEYLILRTAPEPWTPVDTMLSVVAMFFDLQEGDGRLERQFAAARARLGPALADFLYPVGTDWDAALDGSLLPEPPLPGPEQVPALKAAGAAPAALAEAHYGSNNWAVGGALTAHGGGLLASDMHLGHGVPNIWYRARLILEGPDGRPFSDVTGVTLPGTPNVVAGSNGKVAWGFTNSQIDTADVVALEPAGTGGDGWSAYRTPDGPAPFETVTERICAADGACEDMAIQQTRWGPVIATEADGTRLAYRWAAHDLAGRLLQPFVELETAGNVAEVLAIARGAGLPHQNLVTVDAAGAIAWTIIGQVPRRMGMTVDDARTPGPWADGRGWDGWLPGEAVPTVLNPPDGRLWTANSRVVGGEAFQALGDGGYAHGARSRQIRDALLARDRFTEADMLAIQLDDRATLLDRWQALMLQALEARAAADPKLAAMVAPVKAWSHRAVPDNVGYRLVRTFRASLLSQVYGAYLGQSAADPGTPRLASRQSEQPVWRLLTERPAHLVPPGFPDWDAVIAAALEQVKADVDRWAEGDLSRYTWGARNTAAIRHPLSPFVPGLGRLTDAPADPLPGDVYQPRAQTRGFGASERFAVSPGREEEGIFHMPGGQSGHPLAPYYLAGHDAWVRGEPTPFLPGAAVWTLTLEPGGG